MFGPKQDTDGPYAAVIPLFIKSALSHVSPKINGDGSITRDFTPVSNVVQINTKALMNHLDLNKHYVFNVACGQTTSLNEIWQMIRDITETNVEPIYGPNRKGDILFSLAELEYAKKILKYQPDNDIKNQLKLTIEYYK